MILIAYGTRPEIIKLFPVVRELQRKHIPFQTLFTGQQTDLYTDVSDLMPAPDYTFAEKFSGQGKHNGLAESYIKISAAAAELFAEHKFSKIVVQGDTTTAWALSLIGFYNRIKIAHVEAGLRTFDLDNPFPEEANRALIAQIAWLNFAPTARAKKNLEESGAKNIHMVGNTVVDAVNLIKEQHGLDDIHRNNKVLVTLHRRENHQIMEHLFKEINSLAVSYPDLEFVLPIHPNPNVRKHREILKAKNVHVIEPVGYLEMLELIAASRAIITDSGGLQEEASCFNKRVLIARETTERPELVDVGLGKLVGKEIVSNFGWALDPVTELSNSPFGDGKASERIVGLLTNLL
jgi:UDP-N-acetylglucosamine 2-epimerase (non-hydrolysing)